MSNLFDFPKLSTYVKGIVDRQIRSISLSITDSTSYLTQMVTQTFTNATNAHTSDVSAQNAAAGTNAIWASFTSTYGGLLVGDPQTSILGNAFLNNALYIRSSDHRLRVVVSFNNGAPVWQDVILGADPQNIKEICTGKFLSTVDTGSQTVVSPVAFQKSITGIAVTDWHSYQLTTAIDVQQKSDQLTDLIAQETARAQGVETNLAGSINAEHNRAVAAEADERGRATTVEAQINDALNNYAQSSTQALNHEKDRATTVEAQINDALNLFASHFDSGSNANGYWEKRPNIIEQHGQILIPASGTSSASAYIHFPINFDNAGSISINGNADDGVSDSWRPQTITFPGGPSVSGCNVLIDSTQPDKQQNIDRIVFWRAKGYITATGTIPVGNGGSTGSTTGTNNGPAGNNPSAPTPTPAPTTEGGGGGGGDGGTAGGGGGPITYVYDCPEIVTPILLANQDHNGPGIFTTAGALTTDDWVWTQHETTMEWGAYKVTQARVFEGVLWEAPGFYQTTMRHPFYINGKWVTMDTIGHEIDYGLAVAVTIDQAHTFITQNKQGGWVLNHNTKTGG